MKKLFFIVLLLLCVAVAGMGFYITTIDWNKHKNLISQQFFDLTGKQIVFSGPINLKIFPSPYLQASHVKVLSGNDNDKALIEADNLVANLSLIPLLKGNFDVNKMILSNPKINFELQPDGRLNWQSQLTVEQRRKIENSEIALNSVSLKNATVNVDILSKDVSFQISNINGEVIAQSAMGPFRIEGNYIKDNTPQGFAISIGQLSDSFATTLNMVVTHPKSESYARFDGSFMLGNKVLNGNLIIEAKQLRQFLETNFNNIKLPVEYDYPLALTTDISFNEKQINFSNLVLKYGETQGAGTIQLPFNDGFGNDGVLPRLNLAFNFTDFDLDPIVHTLKQFIQKNYSSPQAFNPDLGLDILADIKSVRTTYNNQQIKDFNFGIDIIDNVATINNLSGIIPGDTNITLSGEIKSIDDELFYDIETTLNSHDFLNTLKWINLEPQVSVASTYRKASGEAKISGTLKKIQISPISFTLDKSSVSGEAGIKLGTRPDIMLFLNSDMINFDNYISALPEEESTNNWGQRMAYRFSKLGFLNDIDLQIVAGIDLAIYEKMPFENINFKANLLDGKMDIENLQIKSVANAKIELSGQLTDFGKQPKFNNINYTIQSANLPSLISKLELKAPNWNYKKLKNLSVNGAMNGSLTEFATQTDILLENLKINYKGKFDNSEQTNKFSGELEIKHPDFINMLNELNFQYIPQAQTLGLINLNCTINGTPDTFKAENLNANIGFNTFKGSLEYQRNELYPSISGYLDINKFEIERFLHKADHSPVAQLNAQTHGKSEFWNNPQWSDKIFNYDFYKTFNFNGKLKFQNLSYKKDSFTDVETSLSLQNGTLNINEFKSSYLGGTLNADGKLEFQNTPYFSGQFKLNGADINLLPANGSIYGLNDGTFDNEFNLKASAESSKKFFQTLSGTGKLQLLNFSIKGWNISKIYDDITSRETPDGLAAMVKENLANGSTPISLLTTDLTATDGTIAFQKGLLKGSNYIAQTSGNINIADWSMNLLFDLKFDEPKHFPGFSFSFKDSISSPIPDINVSALFNMYQSQQDKKNAAIQAETERQINKLKNAAQSHKTTADSLLSDLQNKFEPDLKKAQANAFDGDSTEIYTQLQTRSSEIGKKLAQNSLLASSDTLNEASLSKLEAENYAQTQAIEQLWKDLNTQKLSDTQKLSQKLFEQINSLYNQSGSLEQEYNTSKDLMSSRLSKIITDYDASQDNKLIKSETTIKEMLSEFKIKNHKLLDRFSFITSKSDIKQLESYNRELEDFEKQLSIKINDLRSNIQEYIDYTSKLVTTHEQSYYDKLRAEEVERKIEENTGYVNIKKSGKTVTVTRDIEEIEKAEEMTEDATIKVLDFSKPKTSSDTTQTPQQNVVKKGRTKPK